MLTATVSFLLCLSAFLVKAQNVASQWCDSQTDICFQRFYYESLDMAFGYLFPPMGQSSDEFIGIFTGSASAGWIGNSLGGGMRDSLLIVGWMNGGQSIITPRLTSSLSTPPVYNGPTLTILGTSGLNSTHQRIVYRCQNCTTWTGGSIPSSSGSFGYAAHGSLKPITVDDPDSVIQQHTFAGQHSIDIAAARSESYQASLQLLLDLPIESPSPTSTTTTSSIPTPTGPLQCPGAPQPSYAMVAAPGHQAIAVLGGLSSPRGITLDDRGNLLIVERGIGITVHSTDSISGCVTSSKTIVSDTSLNHGIDVLGNKLYASSLTTAYVWDYDSASQTVSNQRTIITGMNNGGHPTRTLWVSRKNPNLLMVSQGSHTNIDDPSYSPDVARAIVKVFDLTATGPVNYVSGGRVLGYGLRNDVGVTEDRAGNIVSIENSMDNAYRTVNGQRTDVHNDNPAEIIWNLGHPETTENVFHGYPYCFFVWEPNSFIDKTFQVGDWFTQEPNSTINDAWCAQQVPKNPLALLPPHSAPLDVKFGIGGDTSIYASLHGSWNRDPPQGYKVVSIPGSYSSSGEWTADVSFRSREFFDVLTNVDESGCTRGCFRPVGLAWSTNGYNLYVSSDSSGEILLVQKNGGENPGTTVTTTTMMTTSSTTSTAPAPTQTLWGQCGGNGYTGPTQCPPGATCQFLNDWYSQCIPN